MHRARRLATLLASLAAALTSACAPPQTVCLGNGAQVTVDAAPQLRVTIDDADGRRLLTLDDVAAATDFYYEEAQLLPGWDGYRESVKKWQRAQRGVIGAHDAQHATVVLEGDATGTLTLDADGPRVRLGLHMDSLQPGAPQEVALTFDLHDDESFFGLGERFAEVDHRGRGLYSWAEEGGLGGGEDPAAAVGSPFPNGPSMTYFPVPFFISSAGYAMHLDTTQRTEVHLGDESEQQWRVSSLSDRLDVVVYAGAPLAALDLYTEDTGRPMVPAPWVFGPRRRVSLGQQVNGVDEWRLLRERHVPTTGLDDAVHFLPHLSQVGQETQLAQWTSDLHAAGYKALAYNNPYVSMSEPAAAADFAYGQANHLFLTDQNGDVASTFFISG
ncbi:MAG TPA: hypothetical protein VGO62_07850, partial [Myxococcota bacterium]